MAGPSLGGPAPGAPPERVAFIGFGLIGGSIALALRKAGWSSELAAWTPAGRGPRGALASGFIDHAAGEAAEALEGAGLVVLAGPPLAILEHLGILAGEWRDALAPGATITDVGSTKAQIVAAADAAGLAFVGGHPMAGREASGVGAAAADLFRDRPWVVVPGQRASAVDVARVETLASATGARPIRLEAGDHDAAVAAISHLPLVLSAALVEAVAGSRGGAAAWADARELAASGWRDMSRLARGDATMGAGILATNAGPVVDRLRIVREVLDEWIELLDPGGPGAADATHLRARLEQARGALDDPG